MFITRMEALSIAACMAAVALGGCDVVEPDDAAPATSTSGGAATAPPRPVSSVCNRSPAVLGGAPFQVNGAFCFGVAQSNSDALTCVQRTAAISECIDELANLAYLVRWSGSEGTVFDYSGLQALGTLKVAGANGFEVSILPNPTVTPRAVGVCNLVVEGAISVAKYCPYTN